MTQDTIIRVPGSGSIDPWSPTAPQPPQPVPPPISVITPAPPPPPPISVIPPTPSLPAPPSPGVPPGFEGRPHHDPPTRPPARPVGSTGGANMQPGSVVSVPQGGIAAHTQGPFPAQGQQADGLPWVAILTLVGLLF